MVVVVLLDAPMPSVTFSVREHVLELPLAMPVVSTLPPGPAVMVDTSPLKLCDAAGAGQASSQAYVQLATPQVDSEPLTVTLVLAPSSTVAL